jgi:hypothetical protein
MNEAKIGGVKGFIQCFVGFVSFGGLGQGLAAGFDQGVDLGQGCFGGAAIVALLGLGAGAGLKIRSNGIGLVAVNGFGRMAD